jgi:hypothetical protein
MVGLLAPGVILVLIRAHVSPKVAAERRTVPPVPEEPLLERLVTLNMLAVQAMVSALMAYRALAVVHLILREQVTLVAFAATLLVAAARVREQMVILALMALDRIMVVTGE